MELDDFKQNWKNDAQQHQVPSYNIDELLIAKSNNPLTVLKEKYRLQVILLPLAATILTCANVFSPAMRNNAFVWLIIPILLILAFIYYRDYAVVSKMQQPAINSLKESMENNLAVLQKNGRQQLRLLGILLIAFIIALEITLYYRLEPAYRFWQNTPLSIRISVYALLLIIQPFISKYFFKLQFGQYITRLQELLRQAA